MKPRVLHICSDTIIGGAAHYVLTLLTQPHLTERYEVAVACPEGALAAALRRAGIQVMLYPGADASFSWPALRSLYSLVRAWRPRIVHTHGALAGRVAAALAGARIVYTKHGLAAASEQAVQVRSPGALLKRASVQRFADRIVAVSEAVARSLVTAGADPQRIRVIPGGVDFGRFDNVGPPIPGVVGAFGRQSREKGFDILLAAMSQLRGEASLILGGEGPQTASLREQVDRLGVPVTMPGFVADVPAFHRQIGIFAQPSRSEGLGLTIVEAMAAGRPVVASRTGGIPEVVVDGETGLLVPPEDSDALAGALRQLLADPNLARRMGEAGRRRAKAFFCAQKMAEQTGAMYEELIAR